MAQSVVRKVLDTNLPNSNPIYASKGDYNSRYINAIITVEKKPIKIEVSTSIYVTVTRIVDGVKETRRFSDGCSVNEDGSVLVKIPYFAVEHEGSAEITVSMLSENALLTVSPITLIVNNVGFAGEISPDDPEYDIIATILQKIKDLEAIPVYKGEGDMSVILNSKANSSTGLRSSAGGYKSKVSGDAAFGHGLDIEVSGRSATGFGERTKVSGIGAGGFGQDNESNGTDSFTSGSKNIANGYCGTSFGNNTKSIGDVSFSEGGNTEARSRYSHAAGLGTIAEAIAQYVVGQYNAVDKNALFVIGNGDSDNARKNALAVYKDKMSVNVPISVVLSMTSDPYNQTTVNFNSSGVSMRTTYDGHFFDFNYIDGVRVDRLKIQNQGITDIDITHFKEAYDNYLPKNSATDGINAAYVKTGDGRQIVVPIRVGNIANSLIQRNEYGRAMITSPLYPDEIANKRYVDEEIAKFDFIKMVDVLPETGLENRIYLIPANETQNLDLFDEYIWINDAWEFLGTKQFEIELEPYATKTYVNDLAYVKKFELEIMLQEVLR